MGCTTITLKTCLGIVSLFFWACAITLIAIGSVILGKYGDISKLADSTDILVPSTIIIGSGVFLFIVGMLGCVGAMKRSKCALSVFFVLTLLILIGEVVAVAFGYQYRDLARTRLTDRLHEMVEDCAGNSTVNDKTAICDELDFLQRTLGCCGADTYKDWYKYTVNSSIPQSCCKEAGCHLPNVNTTNPSDIIYTEGCSNKSVNMILKYFSWIFVGTVIVVILQVLSLVATCIMLFRSQETTYLVLDSQGYRA